MRQDVGRPVVNYDYLGYWMLLVTSGRELTGLCEADRDGSDKR